MNRLRYLVIAAVMAAIVPALLVPATKVAAYEAEVCYYDAGGTVIVLQPYEAEDQGYLVPTGPVNGAWWCRDGEPDADSDGVPDRTDGCPNVAGPAENGGCPVTQPTDTDGDGVPDTIDQCAGTPAGAEVDSNGCPAPSLEELPEGEWTRTNVPPQGTPPTCADPIVEMSFYWMKPIYDRWDLEGGQWVPAGSGIQYEYFPEEVRLSDAEVQACRPQDVEIPGTWRADDPTDCSAMLSMWMTVTVVAPVLNQTTLIWEPGNVADGTQKVRVQFGPREDAGLAPCGTGTPTVTPTASPSSTPDNPDPTPTETPPPGPTLPPGGGGTPVPTASGTLPPVPTQAPDSGSGSDGNGGNPPAVGGLPNTGSGPASADNSALLLVLAGGLLAGTLSLGGLTLRQRRRGA